MVSVERRQQVGEGRDWRAHGACGSTDPEVFFPAAESGPERVRAEAAAKAVCAGCPVRARCLAWALDALPFGVAGGLGEDERAELRRSRSRARRVPVTPVPVRTAGAPCSPSRRAGYAALAAGRARDVVAAQCGVSRRTVDRWAADLIAARTGQVTR
ncbi:WhiB family transcriptional regulator [Pseudonocardia sp. HH130630-07]|uniref:WhiB family transcriptional regulator n=1 Tax=Pseudonocardia sp. HH130630-07 TaxID=1690815 RepID=UPI000839BF34